MSMIVTGPSGVFRIGPARDNEWVVEEEIEKMKHVIGYYGDYTSALTAATKGAGLRDFNTTDRRGLVAHTRAKL